MKNFTTLAQLQLRGLAFWVLEQGAQSPESPRDETPQVWHEVQTLELWEGFWEPEGVGGVRPHSTLGSQDLPRDYSFGCFLRLPRKIQSTYPFS